MDWATRIRKYRQENFLSQQQFADQLNVDQTTVSRWERGVVTPSFDQQEEITGLLRPDEYISDGVLNFLLESSNLVTLADRSSGDVLAVSDGFVALTGMPRSDLVGQTCEEYADPRNIQWYIDHHATTHAPFDFRAVAADTLRRDHTRRRVVHLRYHSRLFYRSDGEAVRLNGYTRLPAGQVFRKPKLYLDPPVNFGLHPIATDAKDVHGPGYQPSAEVAVDCASSLSKAAD